MVRRVYKGGTVTPRRTNPPRSMYLRKDRGPRDGGGETQGKHPPSRVGVVPLNDLRGTVNSSENYVLGSPDNIFEPGSTNREDPTLKRRGKSRGGFFTTVATN